VGLGEASITMAQGEEGPYEELGYTVRNGALQVYLRTDDVDALHAAMAKRGAKVLRAPLSTHYGARCFSVEGPDGMVVVFTQSP
jgi:predicted enzyme related to lactoylglutathione lyase